MNKSRTGKKHFVHTGGVREEPGTTGPKYQVPPVLILAISFLFVCPYPVAFPHLPLREQDFLEQHLRGHSVGAGSEDDDLLDSIRCGDCDTVFFAST